MFSSFFISNRIISCITEVFIATLKKYNNTKLRFSSKRNSAQTTNILAWTNTPGSPPWCTSVQTGFSQDNWSTPIQQFSTGSPSPSTWSTKAGGFCWECLGRRHPHLSQCPSKGSQTLSLWTPLLAQPSRVNEQRLGCCFQYGSQPKTTLWARPSPLSYDHPFLFTHNPNFWGFCGTKLT